MIRFSLHCDHEHEFDGWFRNGDDFETQKKRGFVSCPVCNSSKVEKALMAPSVSTGRKREQIALAMGEEQRKALVVAPQDADRPVAVPEPQRRGEAVREGNDNRPGSGFSNLTEGSQHDRHRQAVKVSRPGGADMSRASRRPSK
jgi:hypothetical protein